MNNSQQPAQKRVNLVPLLNTGAPAPAKRQLIIPTTEALKPAPVSQSVPVTPVGSEPSTSAPVQQQPAYIPPTSAPVQQQPAYIPPTSAPVQQQPAYMPPTSAPVQQQPAYVPPTSAPMQQPQPAYVPPTSAPVQQPQPAYVPPTSAPVQQPQPAYMQPTSAPVQQPQPAASPASEEMHRIVAMTVMQVLKQLEQDYGINVINRKPESQPAYTPQGVAPMQQPAYAPQGTAPVQQPAYAPQPAYGQPSPMPQYGQYGQPQQQVAPSKPWDGNPRGIPGPWNMIIAMRTCIKRYAEFKGRASRSEFWFSMLFHGVVNFLFMILIALSFDSPGAMIGDAVVWMLYNLGAATPVIAAAFRRMHDAGLSATKLWFYFIPLAGPVIVILYLCRPSTGPNEFGIAADYPDPVGSK